MKILKSRTPVDEWDAGSPLCLRGGTGRRRRSAGGRNALFSPSPDRRLLRFVKLSTRPVCV